MTYQPCDPPHDSTDPSSYINAVEIIGASARLPPCPHCDRTTTMIPMSGTGWGLGLTHQAGCPEHEDMRPAVEGYANQEPGGEVPPAIAHSMRFRRVSTRYPRRVAEAYGGDLEDAAAANDHQVAARVAAWERAQGLEVRDWVAIGQEERLDLAVDPDGDVDGRGQE